MKLFVDTNIFVSVIETSHGAEEARKVLNKNIESDEEIELLTSYLNIIELRNVLMKKKHFSRENARRLIEWLIGEIDEVVSMSPDFQETNEIHKEKLMDARDVIFYHIAVICNAKFVSLEREIRHHGGFHPDDLIRKKTTKKSSE